MKKYPVTLLEIGLLSATRSIAGIGLGLVVAEKLTEQRKMVGWAAFGLGAALYVSLVANVVLRDRAPRAG